MEEIFNRKLTIQDIKKINEMNPKFISVSSTKFLDRKILLELNSSIKIRIVGEDEIKNEQIKSKSEELQIEYQKDFTTYSQEEMLQILSLYEEYEESIHEDWSDLQKSLYVYARMIAEYDLATENQLTETSDTLKSFYVLNPNSKGLAKNYKELMDRVGIPCKYVENADNTYAWNEIMIDGEYYPVDLSIDTKTSHAKGPGSIFVHNFGKNSEFYSIPEHKISQEISKKEIKTLDKEAVQQALNVVIDQIASDENKRAEKIRENVKIELHSKELDGVFKGNIVSLDSLKELKPLKINVKDSNFQELTSELQTIATFYPEILDNVEIENTSSSHINMQEVVDSIYDAKKIGPDVVLEPVNITIASNFEEDFDLDLSNVPQVAQNTPRKLDKETLGQTVIFKNIDTSKQIKAPSFPAKISNNISGMSFEGFDLTGLDLRDTKISTLSFTNSSNLDKMFVDTTTSYAVALEAVSPADLNSALTNFTIHDLTIDSVDLRNRRILQELSANPELVKIAIHNAHLNNLDGLEDFDGRLFELNLQVNDLSVSDIERVENFRKTNPYLDAYLNQNTNIIRTIRTSPELSDESYNFIKDYNERTGEKFKVTNKEKAIEFMLWGHPQLPYYIKDAKTIRDNLKIKSNPIMIENNHELENIDFTQDYLKDATLYLTPSQVEYLIWLGKSVPQSVRLKLESVADLSVDDTNSLAQRANALGINITEVQIIDSSRHNNHSQITPYKLSEYVYIRDTLDLITDGINPTDSDIDKFATIYQRLMDNITYDYDAIKENNSIEARYCAEKSATSRNLLEGLEDGKCVCSGYADILKNALAIVGINSENVSGFTRRDAHGNEDGFHSWNMIELDDGSGTKRWYNTDLTWAAGQSPAQMENVTLRGDVSSFTTKHMPWSVGLPTASAADFDRNLLRAAFARAKQKSFNVKDKQTEIDIPEDPELKIDILDQNRILAEYTRRKNDMCAKYYGDKDYRNEYMERSKRFRSHETDASNGSITYRTIEDYPEREADEQFLLLDKYSECLERMTKYEAGDTSVYSGNTDQIKKALEKDKEYVETRNHTFNKNKDVRNSLTTLGKYGEKVPYIPKQTGILKNVGRVVLNTGILTRNIVAPVYRGVGRFVAQPIHKLVVGNRDTSPFRNNWYHRMVARRDYFTEINNQTSPSHPLTNGIKARFDAIFKAKEGNKAVLSAGASEIQSNIIAQERERNLLHSLNEQSAEFGAQIQALTNKIIANPQASNIDVARATLQDKITKKTSIDKQITNINNNRIGISQTDAISDAQHDIAVKEEVTMKTTVIKGFAKGLAVKYVGPKIHDWLAERGTKTITEQVPQTIPVEKDRWVDPTYRTEAVPVYEDVVDTSKTMSEMMSANKGKTVTGFYSVYGGERGADSYILSGNENITAIFQAKGNGGNGLSDVVGLKAPTLVDGTFSSELLTSNGLLNQNITINELLEAVNNGTVDANAIADMYVSVGDRYWTKLSDLTSDLVTQVQTGSELQKVLDVAGHYEKYTDYIQTMKEVTHTIPSERFSRIADASKTILHAGVAVDSIIDVAENARFTKTKIRDNKTNPKNYNFRGDNNIPTSRKDYNRQSRQERD